MARSRRRGRHWWTGYDRHRQGFEGGDVHRCGRQEGFGWAVWKAPGVQRVRGIERLLADGMHGRDALEEDLSGREERQPGMMMVIVE
jgi:hypothetical protein